MTLAFIAAATALTALALAFLVPALWKDARAWALAALLVLPLATLALYRHLGQPDALDAAAVAPPATAEETGPGSLDEAIVQLRQRLEQTPDDLEGWLLLGRSLRFQERFADSLDAYAHAYALAPDEPGVMVEYAEAQVLASPERRIEGQPLALIEQALQRDPTQQRALLLLGAQRMQAGQPAAAAQAWEKLLALVPAESLPTLRERIDEARSQAGLPPLPPPAEASAPSLRVQVSLAPALAASLPQGATLFVFARAVDGPAMPVAAKRLPLGRLPIEVELSNADSPMPSARLFDQDQVSLVARISRTGSANATAGDLEGTLDASPEPGAVFALRIDRVVE